jgi:hypothetical protein
MTGPSRVVYTALVGEYEALNEQPIAERSAVPFVCFTDSPSLTSSSWKIERIIAPMPSDPIRSARRLKIMGHPLLNDYDESLWIDNSVVLRETPETILEAWLDGADLVSPLHGFRSKLIDEFGAVVESGFDDSSRVFEQLRHYLDERPHILEEQPLFTALLARRSTDAVRDASEDWFADVLRYSRRDQLSLLAALDRSPDLRWRAVALDPYESPIHTWPVVVQRDRSGPRRNPLEALKPLPLRIRDLERVDLERRAHLDRMTERAEAAEEQSRALIEAMNHREAEIFRLTDAVTSWQERAEEGERRLAAMEASRAWRFSRIIAAIFRSAMRVAGIRRRA